jgi:hypothetical protein
MEWLTKFLEIPTEEEKKKLRVIGGGYQMCMF